MAYLNQKTDYEILEYYNSCDFINKYNLVSHKKKPIIKEIRIELSLDSLKNSFFSNLSDIHTQKISILFFYILVGSFPLIKFNKINGVDKTNFQIQVSFIKATQIYAFLHVNSGFLKFNNIKHFNFIKLIREKKYKFKFLEVCPTHVFFELENFINKYITIINLKELYFFLIIKVDNVPKLISSNSFVSNFPFLNKNK